MLQWNLETLALIFFAGVFLLYLLKKAIFRQLQLLSFLLFKTPKPGFWLYVVLAFPGVAIHELSHWLMAEVLQVPTGDINFFPDSSSNSKRLGSVKIARTDPFRGLFIGLAPFFSGFAILFILIHFLPQQLNFNWFSLLYFYSIWTVSHGMLVSRSDLRFLPIVSIIFLLIFLAIHHFKITISLVNIQTSLVLILKVLGISIVIGLVFLGLLILPRFLLSQIFLLQKKLETTKIKPL